jgi:hypothetical protein
MSDPYLATLQALGLGVAGNAVYDFVKQQVARPIQRDTLRANLDSFLNMHGVSVRASTIIDAFVDAGLLSIAGSALYAPNKIMMGAGPGAVFSFGHNSVSQTDKTAIHAHGNAELVGSNAAVVQNPDGSISFLVGRDKS